MSTYSVYDIKIDNSLAVAPGQTAGNVLTVNSNGTTYWGSPSTGATGSVGATGATGATGPAPTDSKTFQTLTDAATIS